MYRGRLSLFQERGPNDISRSRRHEETDPRDTRSKSLFLAIAILLGLITARLLDRLLL
jgi:hypothetical protein